MLDCAHTEARSVPGGIGLVKLMGRHAGFITAGAVVASQDVNFALIPEVPFKLEVFLAALKQRMLDEIARRHRRRRRCRAGFVAKPTPRSATLPAT